jgi:uncharacterized SAM-binding protein YcdF (DUF218 family)
VRQIPWFSPVGFGIVFQSRLILALSFHIAKGVPAISFELTKLLSLLVYPLSQVLLLSLLALLAVMLKFRRGAMVLLLLSIGWLYLCSTAFFAEFLMATLEKGYRPRAMSVLPQTDAIVVLGGAARGDTHLGTLPDLNQQADRLVYAAELYRAGKAPLLVLTGGGQEGARPEAQMMKEILAVMGVPSRAILMERASRNTYDNALYSAVVLNNKGIKRILLVTSAFHMRRAVPLFERQGFEVIPAPTDYQRLVTPPVLPPWLPSVDDLARTTIALKEHAGFWVYRWRGWL